MDIQNLFDAALQDARASRFAEAEKKLLMLLNESLKDKDTATIRGLLGAVYVSIGNNRAAVRELTEAAARNPEDATIFSNLSNCLMQAG